MSYASRGVALLGSLAISDRDLSRIEHVTRELKDNAWSLKASAAKDAGELLARADKTAGKVRGALIFNGLVTGLSTVFLVGSIVKTKRRT